MGAERVSYAELAAMADAARNGIDALGLPADRPVAIDATKSPRTIALILACLAARRPFLLPSTELGPASFDRLLDIAGCTALLTAEPAPADGRAVSVDCTPDGRPGPAAASTAERVRGGDIGFMLTTSGSTGLPKVVPLPAGAVDRFTDWAADRFGIGPGTVVLNYAPLNFDLCLLDVWATLKAGGTVVLVEQARATNARYLAELIRAEGVAVVQSVPMLYRLLADAPGGGSFPGVEHVVVTGDKLQQRLLAELPALFPGARICNVYGCTETNDSFLHEYAGEAELPIGRPLPGVDAIVLAEDGTVLDGPATGELLVRTPFQTTGYLDQAAGAGRFVTVDCARHPYLRSGDLVHRDAGGVFTLLGRNDFQVKVRGTRVNLEEIEHVFLDHPDVLEAAVVGVPDDLAGLRIHGVVRGVAPGTPNSLALREQCRLRLPRAAIPATIQIVDEPLPRTSTGKVDRQAIRNDILHRSPTWTASAISSATS